MSIVLIFIVTGIITLCIMSWYAKQKMMNYQTKAGNYLTSTDFSVSKRVEIDLINQNKLEFLNLHYFLHLFYSI